jgi:hypothetical protein
VVIPAFGDDLAFVFGLVEVLVCEGEMPVVTLQYRNTSPLQFARHGGDDLNRFGYFSPTSSVSWPTGTKDDLGRWGVFRHCMLVGNTAAGYACG